jgi:hypothetical protein
VTKPFALDKLVSDYGIKEADRAELEDAVYRARDIYNTHDSLHVDWPKEQIHNLAALADPLWDAIGILNGLIGSGSILVDKIGVSNMETVVEAFGPGVPKPEYFLDREEGDEAIRWTPSALAWLERERTVEADLRATVDRMVAVARIAEAKHQPPRQRRNDALHAAVEPLLDFWRGLLPYRPVKADHGTWGKGPWGEDGPQPGKDRDTLVRAERADRFVYDIMRHFVGDARALGIGTVMRKLTDAALGIGH